MSAVDKNPVFLNSLQSKLKNPLLTACKKLLSKGCINYYINDYGFKTRVFLHNYFPLFNDGPFRVEWEMKFYKANGDLAATKEGTFSKSETAVIEVSDIEGLDTHGIIHTQIRDKDGKEIISTQYGSIFFPEYYIPGTQKRLMGHCLGSSPKAAHFDFDHMSTSIMTPKNFYPKLILGSSCRFQKYGHKGCSPVSLTFINHERKKHTITLDPLNGLECRKLDLFTDLPGVEAHVEDKPYAIHIVGKNILHRPIMIQTNDIYVLGEHL